jgi:transposase
MANLPTYTIVMKSCGGANYWASVFKRSGHTVKLISPQFVKPFVTSRECMQDLYDEFVDVESRLKKLDKKIKHLCQQNERCQRLLKIPGVGELTATAIAAAVPNANEFKNDRHMSAWLGLVPRQSSSGNKNILLGISKRGDRYLSTLLIHGARAALSHYKSTDNEYGRWLIRKKSALNFNKAAVALANKNARIIRKS